MTSRLCVTLALLVALVIDVTFEQNAPPSIPSAHKRFEYKFSFKPPYLAQKDGSVPFFQYSGSKQL